MFVVPLRSGWRNEGFLVRVRGGSGVFEVVRSFRQSDPRPDMGCERDLCRRGGQPLGLGLGGVQNLKRLLEDRRTRPMASEVQTDATRITGNHRGQLK